MSWQSYAAAVPFASRHPHSGVEPRKPAHDFLSGQRRIADLAVLFCSLARGKDARRHRTCANQFSHDAVNPIDIEKMVVFTLRDENILLHTLEDTLKVVRRKASETNQTASSCR